MPVIDSPRDLRNALGKFVTGVTVVTALDKNGQPVGLTANSFSSVSLEPPMVSWCLGKDSTRLDIFSQAEHYAIHILGEHQQELSNLFASPDAVNLDQIKWRQGNQGVPLLDGVETIFQCQLKHRYHGGDHLILVGLVTDYCHDSINPLIFFEGGYRTLSNE